MAPFELGFGHESDDRTMSTPVRTSHPRRTRIASVFSTLLTFDFIDITTFNFYFSTYPHKNKIYSLYFGLSLT